MTTKVCTVCGEEKSVREFHKQKNGLHGVRGECSLCYRTRHRSVDGLVSKIYTSQKMTSKYRGHEAPKYTKQELYDWFVRQPNSFDLMVEWEKSEWSKDDIPSVDRIDDYKGYSLDNIQLTTFRENRARSHKDFKSGKNNKQSNGWIVATDIATGEILEFCSQQRASRELGILQSGISQAINGKISSYKGYCWKYKEKSINGY